MESRAGIYCEAERKELAAVLWWVVVVTQGDPTRAPNMARGGLPLRGSAWPRLCVQHPSSWFCPHAPQHGGGLLKSKPGRALPSGTRTPSGHDALCGQAAWVPLSPSQAPFPLAPDFPFITALTGDSSSL